MSKCSCLLSCGLQVDRKGLKALKVRKAHFTRTALSHADMLPPRTRAAHNFFDAVSAVRH